MLFLKPIKDWNADYLFRCFSVMAIVNNDAVNKKSLYSDTKLALVPVC